MSEGRFAGRVAVVTGAASGIGRATVDRFLAEGASVVLADLNVENGESVLAEIAAAGLEDRARFTRVDVAVEDDVAAAISMAVEAFGRLDIVFNNAGVGGAIGPITELRAADWDYTFGVLVRGVMFGTKHAARVMIEQDEGGSIINTASVAGLSAGAGPQAYSAAKAAVINLSQTTAVELAPHRIRVNAICPGMIFTPLMHAGDEAQAAQVAAEVQPLPDLGQGSDIANAALWLADDATSFVTGQAIVVDGGLTAAGPQTSTKLAGTRNIHRIVGVTYGSTGKAAEVQRLE